MFSANEIVTIAVIICFVSATANATLLVECPGSDVPTIRQQAANEEVALVYYYTSWNRISRNTKTIYADLAQHYHQHVYFAAVDCWHFACNCSRTHEIPASLGSVSGSPHKWPTLMVHYGKGNAIQYHGEWDFPALTRFMSHLYMPLERVHSRRELKLLAMRCDAVVLGLFATPNVPEYRIFTAAAVKWLETDPEKAYRFVVAFNSAAHEIVQDLSSQMPQILLFNRLGIEMFNDSTSSGRIHTKWNADQIITWTQRQLKHAYSHTSGYSTPVTLTTRLRTGPALVIFANDLSFPQHFYTHMEEIIQQAPSTAQRFAQCDVYRQRNQQRMSYPLQLETAPNVTMRQTHFTAHNLKYYFHINRQLDDLYRQYKHHTTVNPKWYTKSELDEDDDCTAAQLLAQHEYSSCLEHPQRYHTAEVRIAIAKFLKKSVDNLLPSGVAMRNRTLSVVILDTGKYRDFLNTFSIDQSLMQNAAAAAIVDPRLESVYVMQESYTYDALLHFVQQYYAGNLVATRRSSSGSSSAHSQAKAETVQLEDINRQRFLQVIAQHNVTSVVLLYSPACAFSSIYTQALLQLFVFLNADDVKFLRLNTQVNDLPWEYSMHRTPTLIVFPRGRFAESRVYPAHLQVNVRNLLGFILAQLDPLDQVRTVWNSCKRNLPTQQLQKCLQFAKNLVTQHIAHHLKFWQIFENDRSVVLERLKEFKDISLSIQRSFRS